MNKKLFCTKCGEEREYEIKKEKESYPVRNEMTEIDAKVTYCKECNTQIWNDEIEDKNLESAYRKYREKNNLLQPEEIKMIRDKYNLSQSLFAKILGFGEKTITRYENGSIQDVAQNNLIELASYPEVFELLLQKGKNHLSSSDYDRIMQSIRSYKFQFKIEKKYLFTKKPPYQYENISKQFGGRNYVS